MAGGGATAATGTGSRREFRSGLYEIVKYGMIASRDRFERVAREMTAISKTA